ncbi:MAG: class I SAM-dependent methyltransferase [Spirochaetales bacterium]|nr:class I SAM-dependent methyltransferase [Spirochaetales bacterium]
MNENFDNKAATWDANQQRVIRAKELFDKILEVIPVGEDMSILDFGCGTGLLGFNFAPHVKHVTFADTSAKMLEQVEQKALKLRYNNCTTLNLEKSQITRQYNIIASLLTLHHITEFETAIINLLDSLTPGGYICLCDLDPEDGSFHREQVPHCGIQRRRIHTLLEARGIQIISNTAGITINKTIDNLEKEYTTFLIIGKKLTE